MIKVASLHDMVDLRVAVTVVSPVATLRGPKELEHDDEVEVLISVGRVRIEATLTAGEYKQMIEARIAQSRVTVIE